MAEDRSPSGSAVAEACRATPNCPGLILEGYCDVCGKKAPGGTTGHGSRPGTGSSSPGTGSTRDGSSSRGHGAGGTASRGSTSTKGSSSRWKTGTPVIELPFMPPVDPASAVMEVPVVPEDKRYCSGCHAQVGRARDG